MLSFTRSHAVGEVGEVRDAGPARDVVHSGAFTGCAPESVGDIEVVHHVEDLMLRCRSIAFVLGAVATYVAARIEPRR